MTLIVDIFREEITEPLGNLDEEPEPTDSQIINWLTQAFEAQQATSKKKQEAKRLSGEVIVNVALVRSSTIKDLNLRFRAKDKPTNVLSFPTETGLFDDQCEPEANQKTEDDFDNSTNAIQMPNILGDILFCPTVIEQEALLQKKKPEHHWAHIAIHGLLHLLGYDHIDDNDAATMEALEIKLLSSIGVADPYQPTVQ